MLVGFSNYIWNEDISYQYISRIKQRFPGVITVVGGPNYSFIKEEQIQWLESHPDVDLYIYRDGEIPFARMVEFLLDNPDVNLLKKAKLPSCHAFHEGEAYFGEGHGERLMDLSSTPSPYLLGMMDKFFDGRLRPAVQTNRGCPFACKFCIEGEDYYNKISKSSIERKKAELEYIAERSIHARTLLITDSNFGMFNDDITYCEAINQVRKTTGFPEYIHCTTGKNKKENVLKCNELVGGILRLTASVQSLDEQVLENVARTNISLESISFFSDETSDTESHSYSELILGLPGDSRAGHLSGFKGLMDTGISLITQHQFALFPGIDLDSFEVRKKFGMITQFRPIQRCVGVYSFGEDQFTSVETEEICTGGTSLSFEDYIEMRRLFLTTGLFYNDRIFSEIHAFLRLLGISTFDWIKYIYEHTEDLSSEISNIFDDFVTETKNELWTDRQKMMDDVSASINRYISGELGINIIYKFRSIAIISHFDNLVDDAYRMLEKFLCQNNNEVGEELKELNRFSRHQKSQLLNLEYAEEEEFSFDVVKLVSNVNYAREGGTLKTLKGKTLVRFSHDKSKKEMLQRQLNMYGSDSSGAALLFARFPVKRFYRRAQVVAAVD